MFNKQLLAILIPLTLSGCGGGSDDSGSSQPKPTPKYTFEFAEFYEPDPSANISRCSVYGLRTSGDGDVNVLAAVNESLTRSKDKLLIQNSEGDVERSIGLTGSKEVLLASDVPDGGFVTFYIAPIRGSSSKDAKAISIQKSLLEANKSLAFGYALEGNTPGDCVKGANAPSKPVYERINLIKPKGSAEIFSIATEDMRYMTLNTVLGEYSIETNDQYVMGAVYNKDTTDSDSGDISEEELDTSREITDYKFFNLADYKEGKTNNIRLTSLRDDNNSWTAPASTSEYNLTSAALYVDYQQTPYIWQNLPYGAIENIGYRYDADNDNLSYYLTAEGSVDASGDQWQLSTAQQLSTTQLSMRLDNASLTDDITIPSQRSVDIASWNLTAYGKEADDQAGIQRIAYQATESPTTVTHVIYAEANAEQTIPMFDDNGINAVISGAGTLSNYDISVMYTSDNTDQRQALAALMAEHTDPGQSDITDLSLDNLPVLFTTYEREQLARQKKIIDHYQISTSNP